MVRVSEKLLQQITLLAKDGGEVTCNNAPIKEVAGLQCVSKQTQPVVGTDGYGVFWVKEVDGYASIPQFTDSNNNTITLGGGSSQPVDPINLDGYALEVDLLDHTTNTTIHFTAESLGLDGYALTSDTPNINLDGYALDVDLLAHTTDVTIHFTAESLGLDGYALPSGGVPPELLGYNTDVFDVRMVRFVTAIGSDIWFPGDMATLGVDQLKAPVGLAKTNDGYTFTIERPAATASNLLHGGSPTLLDGASPSLMVYDAQEDVTLLLSHNIVLGDGVYPTTPGGLYTQNVTSTTPFVADSYNQMYGEVSIGGGETAILVPRVLRCYNAPGNGYIYCGVRSDTQWSSLCRYNVSTGLIDQINNSETSSIWTQTAHGIEYDNFTDKYGDGYARLYVTGKDSFTIFRINTNDFSTGESEASFFPDFGGAAAVLTIDGYNNAGYTTLLTPDNYKCIVKFTLEPFGTVLYNFQFADHLGGTVVGIKHVPSEQKIVILHEHYESTTDSYVAFVTVVRDTGSSFVLDFTYEIPAYLGSASCYTYCSNWDFDPQISLINGNVYIPLVGGRGDETMGTFDRLNSVLVLDPTVSSNPVALLPPISLKWVDPFASGDVQYDPTFNDNLNSPNGTLRSISLRGYPLNFSINDIEYPNLYQTGNLRAGKVPTFTVAGSLSPTHPDSRFTTSSDHPANVALPYDYNGLICRQTGTSTYVASLNNLQGNLTYGGEVSLHFINGSSQTMNNNSGKFRVDCTTVGGFSLYGLTGDPMGTLSYYTSHSAREALSFLWDNKAGRYQCTGKYRPWETVTVAVTGPTVIYGGLVNVHVTTGTSGTRDIRLPPVYNHDDEIIVKDINGNAHLCPIRVNGQTGTIDGYSASALFIINQPYGYFRFKYDSTVNTWVVIAEMGTERNMAITSPTAASTGDVEGYGAVLTYGATLGPGGTPGVDWRRVESTTIVGPANALMEAWQIDTDGFFRQTDTTSAGNLYLPLSLIIGARLGALYIYLQRLTGVGVAATTPATAMIQRRTRAVGNTAPGAWEAVPSIVCVNSTPANLVQELIVGDTNYASNGYWTVVTGYDYRLMINGEFSTNAQPVKLLNMHAYMR